jgi:very-short-patch-repair endonuclease
MLWRRLRGRPFGEFKFRRQLPVKGYIADLCCPEKKLIVELDGGHHIGQAPYDNGRTAKLEESGYKVIRFWNTEIVENIDGILEAIYTELNKPSP